MKLNEISGKDTLTARVVAMLMTFAPILQFAEFYSMVGNADNLRKEATASGGSFRALNSDFASNEVDPVFASVALKILGDKVSVDKAHERRGGDIASVRLSELDNFSKKLARQFQNYFVNADSAVANQFSGLKKIMPAGQKITPATNGIQVTLGNTDTAKKQQQVFIEYINQLIESVENGAQLLMMDTTTLSRLDSIAREFIKYDKTNFGTRIAFFNEIPIILSGYDKAGAKVIPHTETVGTSTDCTSIYALRFGEKSDLTFATNIGVQVDDLGLVGVHYTHNVDLDLDLALASDKAVARLEGVRIIQS